MTADVNVRAQDPSWVHNTPIGKQCASIREASDPRRQQDPNPASAPTEEAPNHTVETTIPTTHSQTFADETNNIAVESPVTQPSEDSSVPVPGSRKGKRIYYLAPVQCDTWTQEDYNRRFIFVKNELQSMVNGDPKSRDRAPYVSYELRMVGINRDQAVPSIIINCRERDMRFLRSLFARANKKLGRGKGSLTDRLPWARPQTIPIPPLPLVYCGFKGGPVIQKMSDESITAYFGNESTYCGGLLQYQGASATLGPTLHINGIIAQLTVNHVFRSKRSVEPIAIPAQRNSPSDTPHTTPYDVDIDSLDNLWGNDDDEYDYEDEPESGVEDESSDSTSPEVETATMRPSQKWEKIIPPRALHPSSPYLDWVLARPLPGMESPPPLIGFLNALFPDGPGGRRVVISKIRHEPPVHLAPVYVISGVRGVLRGHILASSTFLGSPANQADTPVWTVIVQSPQGLISGECGSVVVDQNTHEAYGHVIGCNPWGHALVVPLGHVLSQVTVSFGATHVGLASLWDVILGLPSQSQLNQAYRQDDLSFIKRVLATGEVEVNSMDDLRRTPLHRAVNEGNEAVVKLLLQHGAYGGANARGQTLLHCAALKGNEAIARLLLEHGADKDAKDYSGRTPLHRARNETIVKLLLEHGADKEVKDFIGETPLMGRRIGPDVRLLAEHGADKEAKDSSGQTPFYLAAEEEYGAIPSNAIPSKVPAREHLHQALGEIDGFLAGMRYLDETETLAASEPGDGPFDLVGPLKATTPPPLIHQSAAWSSIRDLRDGIQYYWQHFVKVLQNLDDPIINKLHTAYKDARGLREAGVFAFRNTLIRLVPNDLRKVFALYSLYYVMSRLLHARGRFEATESLAGVSLWLHALQTPGEQEAFKILARSLWTETRHFDFSDQDPIIWGLEFSKVDPDETHQGQSASPSHPQFGAPRLGPMPDVTEQRSSVSDAASIWMNNPGELYDTKVFATVLQYCHDNGDFWYNLSNQGAISKDMRSLLTWNQECAREKKLIYEQYLKHLLLEKDTKDVASRGIVLVAEGFIDIGYLQSTDEAKKYMMNMARLIFTDSKVYDRFITWITDPEKSYSCPTCNIRYRRKHSLESHCELVHNKKVKIEGAGSGGDKLEMPMTDSLGQDCMKG